MEFYQLGTSGLLGLGISASFILLILKVHRHYKLPDRAAELHHGSPRKVPMPRFGGIALAAAYVSVIFLAFLMGKRGQPSSGFHIWQVAVFSLAMFGLGLWDDFFSLGAKRKLAGQLLVAGAAYYFGIGIHKFQIPFLHQVIDLGLWSGPVTIFWLVGMTNLINLIDGIDGLAGGICLMLMLLMSYVGEGTGGVAFIAAGMVGALLGFLWFNFPPARIYMGDSGAYFLGFLIGCMTIVSSQKGTIFAALTAPLFVLALPILDTSLAIMRRGLHGLPLFRPDRHHIHHRLLETGVSRRKIVLGFYAFTAFFLVLGFAAFWWNGQHFELLLGIAVLVVLLAAGKFNFSREWFAVGRMIGNSMEARGEIQYAIAQSRWLAMEGTRCHGIEELCEDAVFIARKLGYVLVRIRLEDSEKTWRLADDIDEKDCRLFKHTLPGHRHCFLELGAQEQTTAFVAANETAFKISGDLLAEGWAKAVHAWQKQSRLPLRFDARATPYQPYEKALKSSTVAIPISTYGL